MQQASELACCLLLWDLRLSSFDLSLPTWVKQTADYPSAWGTLEDPLVSFRLSSFLPHFHPPLVCFLSTLTYVSCQHPSAPAFPEMHFLAGLARAAVDLLFIPVSAHLSLYMVSLYICILSFRPSDTDVQ